MAATAVAAPGTSALEQARRSWDDGAIDRAEQEYEQALARGGLDRASTLECWIHIGAARAVLGKKSSALSAFRMALLIDDNFSVPPEAGKKAVQLADSARRHGNRVPPLHMSLSAPSEAPGGEPFAVNVLLDDGQAPLIARLSLRVEDATTHKTYDYEDAAASVVHFRVPASMTLPGASLRVEVAALDEHDNQLAVALQHVTIRPTPIAETHPTKDLLRPSHGGFWSSPWPYILGGAALAAGGAAAGYFLLKPPDSVSVGPATLQTH
ncbi:MAG TPA: hypothetical protein VGH28_04735 [Polyangiaceae bacterium]|jgi:hypothetical protein